MLRIAPRIDEKRINSVIDETPLLTEVRRDFYKRYLRLRKHMIIDKAYQFIKEGRFDAEALARLENGVQYSDALLKQKISSGELKAK